MESCRFGEQSSFVDSAKEESKGKTLNLIIFEIVIMRTCGKMKKKGKSCRQLSSYCRHKRIDVNWGRTGLVALCEVRALQPERQVSSSLRSTSDRFVCVVTSRLTLILIYCSWSNKKEADPVRIFFSYTVLCFLIRRENPCFFKLNVPCSLIGWQISASHHALFSHLCLFRSFNCYHKMMEAHWTQRIRPPEKITV